MKTKTRKGFTLVELVIVIAVIAILAAVLIPTFSSLIRKANLSADLQAVTTMNNKIAIANAEKDLDTIDDVILALNEQDVDIKDYKPLTKNTYFYWVKGLNKIIHVDENDTLIAPTNLGTVTTTGWYSLSGDVPTKDNYTITTDGSVEISEGAQLVDLMEKVSKGSADVNTITLNAGTIDLRGTTVNFETISKEITLEGTSVDGTKLTGLRGDDNCIQSVWDGHSKICGYGLFGQIKGSGKVIVKNLTIEGVTIGETQEGKASGHAGIIAGNIESGSLEVENVTINNCKVLGSDKAGSIVGYVNKNATVKLKNVKVTNTEVLGHGFVAKAIGCIGQNEGNKYDSTVTFDECDFAGVTTGINEFGWSSLWWDSDINFITNEPILITDIKAYRDGCTDTYVPYKNTEQLAAMVTNEYYWFDNKTHELTKENDDLVKKEVYDAVKIEINGQNYGYKLSGSTNVNRNDEIFSKNEKTVTYQKNN